MIVLIWSRLRIPNFLLLLYWGTVWPFPLWGRRSVGTWGGLISGLCLSLKSYTGSSSAGLLRETVSGGWWGGALKLILLVSQEQTFYFISFFICLFVLVFLGLSILCFCPFEPWYNITGFCLTDHSREGFRERCKSLVGKTNFAWDG